MKQQIVTPALLLVPLCRLFQPDQSVLQVVLSVYHFM
jgi:hypothetical protein